jgi:hypothetical protein
MFCIDEVGCRQGAIVRLPCRAGQHIVGPSNVHALLIGDCMDPAGDSCRNPINVCR